MSIEEPIDTVIYCSRCGAKEAHFYGTLSENVTLGDNTKIITLHKFYCRKCGQITMRRNLTNMIFYNFEIWRNKNQWIAVRESDHYTIKADTFSELIIKIDQTQQEGKK